MATPNSLNKLYRWRDLPPYVGLRKTAIEELIKAGEFPKPVPLSNSGRAVAWLEVDLIAWQTARIAARNASIAERSEAKVETAWP